MSYLYLYFLLKVGLHFAGYTGFDWPLNLALWLAAAAPVPRIGWQRARGALVWASALALMYSESYLPSATRLLSQAQALAGFSAQYWLELGSRLVSMQGIAVGLAGLALYALLARRLRFATFALVGILSVPLAAAVHERRTSEGLVAGAAGASVPTASTAGSPAETPDALLRKFYADERGRRVELAAEGTLTAPPFDIILLHVCSLSWDDMDFVGQRDHPFLQRFDVLFTNFNTAASYSGPSSLRVLHGLCGQTPHDTLYTGIDPQCYVFPALEKLGYRTAALLNHDGVYEEFAPSLERFGGLGGKLQQVPGAPVHMQNFDGSPIFNDRALLSQWWRSRGTPADAAPVALYYNTISLHDGNRVPGMASRSSLDTYKPRLLQLLADFDRFIAELEAAGRPVVVMLVPEHGASLRGDKFQIAGMREIPGPRITLVPAAVKLVGMRPRTDSTAEPVLVNQPTSYMGLFALLGDLIRDNPFSGTGRPLKERVRTPEVTPYVSENADVVVIRDAAGRFVMKSGRGDWIPYPY